MPARGRYLNEARHATAVSIAPTGLDGLAQRCPVRDGRNVHAAKGCDLFLPVGATDGRLDDDELPGASMTLELEPADAVIVAVGHQGLGLRGQRPMFFVAATHSAVPPTSGGAQIILRPVNSATMRACPSQTKSVK